MSTTKSRNDSGPDSCAQENGPSCQEAVAQELMKLIQMYPKQISQLASILSSSGEYGILYCLQRDNRSYSAGELAYLLGLTPGRITNILKALEKKRLVVRQHDPADKRRVIVSLTDHGQEYVCKVYADSEQAFRKVVEAIGEEDSRTFIRITKKLFAISKEASPEEPLSDGSIL